MTGKCSLKLLVAEGVLVAAQIFLVALCADELDGEECKAKE